MNIKINITIASILLLLVLALTFVLASGLQHFRLQVGGTKMTCADTTSRQAAVNAAKVFSDSNDSNAIALHDFLRESGFFLRNIVAHDADMVLVYVTVDQALPCLSARLLSIDSTLLTVRISSNFHVTEIR